jgi:hypothetical protein
MLVHNTLALSDPVVIFAIFCISLVTILSIGVLVKLRHGKAKLWVFYVSHSANIVQQILNLLGIVINVEPYTSIGGVVGTNVLLGVALCQLEILTLFSPFVVSTQTVKNIRTLTWVLYFVSVIPNNVYNIITLFIDISGKQTVASNLKIRRAQTFWFIDHCVVYILHNHVRCVPNHSYR